MAEYRKGAGKRYGSRPSGGPLGGQDLRSPTRMLYGTKDPRTGVYNLQIDHPISPRKNDNPGGWAARERQKVAVFNQKFGRRAAFRTALSFTRRLPGFNNPFLNPDFWPISPWGRTDPGSEEIPGGWDLAPYGYDHMWGRLNNCGQFTSGVRFDGGCIIPEFECLGGQVPHGGINIGDPLTIPSTDGKWPKSITFMSRTEVTPGQYRGTLHEHWCYPLPPPTMPETDVPYSDPVPARAPFPMPAYIPFSIPDPQGWTPFNPSQLWPRDIPVTQQPMPENMEPGGSSGGGGATGTWGSPEPQAPPKVTEYPDADFDDDEDIDDDTDPETPLPGDDPVDDREPESRHPNSPTPPITIIRTSPPWGPPPRGEKEDKVRLIVPGSALFRLWNLYGTLTEVRDLVDALIDAYEGDAFRPYGRPLQEKLRWLYRNWEGVNKYQAVKNAAWEQLQDIAISIPHRAASRSLGRAARMGYGSGRGGPGYSGLSRVATYGTRF